MVKKALTVALFLAVMGSCSKYYQFDELYDKGDFVRAYQLLEQVKNKNNLHYQKRYFRIVFRLALDGDADFIAKLDKVVEEDHLPEVNYYIRFGRTYKEFLAARQPAQYSGTVSNLSNIKDTPVEFALYAYKMRAIARYKLGDYREALEDFQQSYKIIPYVDNLYFMGMCLMGMDDYKQAAAYFNRCITGALDSFMKSLAYFQLGEIDYYQNQYADALGKYTQAVNFYSDSPDYTYKMAKCMQKLRYNRISPKLLRTSLRIQKDYANAWFFLNIH